ncbi:hypothetical protein Ddye_011132 [Dipteronia dyeriana]|uniref:SWIM-type domain-containing protein n=1 Tax=Dipteronia dyeriana TaxID=168575 RepID=A0AAD9XEJ0_9ROSI|nr:hypothetical protein Ddye_011132 [Dipteronia dyeriana]
MQTVVKYDDNKYSVDQQCIFIVPGTTCHTFIRNDDDVQFMLGGDTVIPLICVSLIERPIGGVIGEVISPHVKTQQFRSLGGSNQLFTERSEINGRENMCGVPPEVAGHGELFGTQFNDVFGYQIEMNDGQFNHHFNEFYNDMNSEENIEPNLGPINELVEKCGYMTVNPVEWNVFSIKWFGKQLSIDLARKTCTCNKFEMDMFPCSHALAAARERNLDFISLCADFYKRQTLIDAYSISIIPIGHSSSLVVPADIAEHVALNPLSRRQTGRPRGGCHPSSLERTTTLSCGRCGQSGHNARRCPNSSLNNDGPSRVVPQEYRHKCSICHSVGHNKQTFP